MSLKSLGLFVPLKNESASGWCITAACLSLQIWCRLAGVVCARAEKGYSREHKKSLHFNMRARQWERNSSSAALLFYLIAVSAWRRADLWLLSWCESCCGLLLKHSISALHLTPLRARRDHRSRMIYNYNTNFESGRPFLLALDVFFFTGALTVPCGAVDALKDGQGRWLHLISRQKHLLWLIGPRFSSQLHRNRNQSRFQEKHND
jgi:hypothetical protein